MVKSATPKKKTTKRKKAVSSKGGKTRKPKRKKAASKVAEGTAKANKVGAAESRGSCSRKEELKDHRRRQASVALILDNTFGTLAESDPQLWGRRAYLMLVGLVYERLATNEAEISTDELVTLAKTLAENRRADARTNSSADKNDSPHNTSSPQSKDETLATPTPPDGPLPQHFADAVREVYGI